MPENYFKNHPMFEFYTELTTTRLTLQVVKKQREAERLMFLQKYLSVALTIN